MATEEEVTDFLEHFGVKGMKWGVRRDSSGSGGRAPSDRKVKRQVAKADIQSRKAASKERLAKDRERRNNEQYDKQVEEVRRDQASRARLTDRSNGGFVRRQVKEASFQRKQLDDDIWAARERIEKSNESLAVAKAQFRKDKTEIGRKAAKITLNEAKEIRWRDLNDNRSTANLMTQQEEIDAAIQRAFDVAVGSLYNR